MSEQKQGNLLGIVLIVAAILFAVVSGVLGYFYSNEIKKGQQIQADLDAARGQIAQTESLNKSLENELADQRAEIERLRNQWEEDVAKLKAEHRERLERSYAQMNDIIYDGRKTLEYIGAIEDKLKAGKSLSEQEAKKLDAVASGLTLLHKAYERPIHEFRELDTFLTEQLELAAVVPPDNRLAFFKRIFSSDYRATEEAYFRDQGQREAFERARVKVQAAYSRAQSEMKKLTLQSDTYLDQLAKITENRKASAAEVDQFFDKSREILEIHDRIMSIEPEMPEAVRP